MFFSQKKEVKFENVSPLEYNMHFDIKNVSKHSLSLFKFLHLVFPILGNSLKRVVSEFVLLHCANNNKIVLPQGNCS